MLVGTDWGNILFASLMAQQICYTFEQVWNTSSTCILQNLTSNAQYIFHFQSPHWIPVVATCMSPMSKRMVEISAVTVAYPKRICRNIALATSIFEETKSWAKTGHCIWSRETKPPFENDCPNMAKLGNWCKWRSCLASFPTGAASFSGFCSRLNSLTRGNDWMCGINPCSHLVQVNVHRIHGSGKILHHGLVQQWSTTLMCHQL